MSKPAAKKGDKIFAVDTHIVIFPSPGGGVPIPIPMPFCGSIIENLSSDVIIEKKNAATKGSIAYNMPMHLPSVGPFQRPPSNKATIKKGSAKVLINNQEAAHLGDPADTCNDPADDARGTVLGTGTVLIGD